MLYTEPYNPLMRKHLLKTSSEKRQKGYMDETQYPDYYVKLNRFFPIFPQPYTFYQNNSPENLFNDNLRIWKQFIHKPTSLYCHRTKPKKTD